MRNLFSIVRRSAAVLIFGSTLIAPIHAMYSSKPQGTLGSVKTETLCSNFRKNSVFSRFLKDNIQKANLRFVDRSCDSVMIYHLSKFYEVMDFYIGEQEALNFPQNISGDLVLSLIDYIRNYKLNVSGVSVCELYFLTLECIARVHGNMLPDFRDMGFKPSEDKVLSMSTSEFKEFLVNSLTVLYGEIRDCLN